MRNATVPPKLRKGVHDIEGSYQRNNVFYFEINKSVLEPVNILDDGRILQTNDYCPYASED
jgi:hypothetical protein